MVVQMVNNINLGEKPDHDSEKKENKRERNLRSEPKEKEEEESVDEKKVTEAEVLVRKSGFYCNNQIYNTDV